VTRKKHKITGEPKEKTHAKPAEFSRTRFVMARMPIKENTPTNGTYGVFRKL
jgi:hypothetical protein